MQRPIREILRRLATDHPENFTAFSEHIARLEGWELYGQPEAARKYLLRLLNSGHRPGHAPRNLDADWALIALDFFPDDEIARVFARRAAMAAVRAEQDPSRMVKVSARRRVRGAA